TLVVAISQSGTTTDTNRTVDLARARGAAVVSIVNRRNSDLVEKSDGVLFTSDGRDVEMSVASTKAFYPQVAAGFLLAVANAADVAKEVAIYRAHRAAPIVIVTEGEHRFRDALETITVPAVHPALAFVLSAMVGHVFGYEAALAIDASARPLREARAAIQAVVAAARDAGARIDVLASLAH